jgi:hypothetical protein
MRWICVAILVGCGSVKNSPDAPSGIDSPMQADAPAPACDLTKAFGTPTALPVIHDPNGNDVHATLTTDELAIYFASDRQTAGKFHIYSASRAAVTDPFGTPAIVSSLFSMAGESHPSVSPDGNTIFFDSYPTDIHVFTSTRANATVVFPPPSQITGDALIDPAITADGSALYVANLSFGNLQRMEHSAGGFGAGQSVDIPATSSLVSPVTNDDLTMFMSLGDTTGNTIAVTHRTSKTMSFPAPQPVAELQIGASLAEPSWLSADGCRLYLTYGMTGGKSTIFVATRPR